MLVQGREDSKLPSQGSSGLLIWFIFLFSGCSHEPQSKHRCFLSISPQRCPINLLINLKFLGPSKKFFASYFEFSGTQPVAPFGTSENPCVGTGVSIFVLSMSTPVPQGCILKTSRGVTWFWNPNCFPDFRLKSSYWYGLSCSRHDLLCV